MTASDTDEGAELGLFAGAVGWKRYWAGAVRAYVAGDVLEVGAGIGANTALLASLTPGQVTCLEPDAALAAELRATVRGRRLDRRCRVIVGDVASLPPGSCFDTVLYVDVLEHIADDAGELSRASARLRPGGHLVVLAPAHGALYSAFDRALGHVRRYDRRALAAAGPADLDAVRFAYLDACGLVASAANRFIFNRAMPSRPTVWIWDRVLVRFSTAVDRLTCFRIGKSIIGVWRRPGNGAATAMTEL